MGVDHRICAEGWERLFAERTSFRGTYLTEHLSQLDPLSVSIVLLPFFFHASGGTILISSWLTSRTNFETDGLKAGAQYA